jgi:hypothetical protein
MRPISEFYLPPEIFEHILLSLPPADILKMKEVLSDRPRSLQSALTPNPLQVSRFFLDFVSSSQHLQHRIDLFSAGLVDNPHTARSLAERRVLLRKYVDGWKDAEPSVRYDCPLRTATSEFDPPAVDQDLFPGPPADRTNIPFLRVPSSPNQGTVKEWTLGFQFQSSGYVVRSQDNLLAVIEQGIG